MSITQEQKQDLVNNLISEWEYMKSSYSREDLTDDCGNSGIDVRLQVVDDELNLHVGDSQYDTNHYGDWASATLDYDWEEEVLESLITDLVEDLLDQVDMILA